eukprot:630131-Amphidinium_carterae.1
MLLISILRVISHDSKQPAKQPTNDKDTFFFYPTAFGTGGGAFMTGGRWDSRHAGTVSTGTRLVQGMPHRLTIQGRDVALHTL